MWYWFSPMSVILLMAGVMSLVNGILLDNFSPNLALAPLFYAAAGIVGLAAAYCIVRRRRSVFRFKTVFGFMPSFEKYSERFRHLVLKEIRSRAEALRAVYGEEEDKRSAMAQAIYASAADSLQQDYELARRSTEGRSRMFYGAIDAATSKWLPVPYTKIERSLNKWIA